MQPKSDAQLLRDYAQHQAETAFTELVQRHTNLVYSAALRQVESPDVAAEIAQNVFIGLARSAKSLSPTLAAEAPLAGWLCRSARNLSLNHRRDEFRRLTRERHAMEQALAPSDEAPDWEKLRHVLDDAMSELSETDYDALVLRFYQNQDFRSIGAAIGLSDDTAQKRVSRALDKLRELLAQRGIRTTSGALGIAISVNAVQAAPAALAATITTAALASTVASTATVVATTKTIAMTTLQKTLITGTVAILAGVGIYEARQATKLRAQVQMLKQQVDPLNQQVLQLQTEHDNVTNGLTGLLAENLRMKSNQNELLRLRGEIGLLRQQLELSQGNITNSSNSPSWTPLDLTQFQDSGIVIKRAATTNAGLATPAALLQTWLWALRTKDAEGLEMVFHCQPGEEAAKQQLIQGISQSEEKPSDFDNYSLITLLPIEDDSYIALIAEESQHINLQRRAFVMKQVFRRIGNEWKLPVSHPGHALMGKIPH